MVTSGADRRIIDTLFIDSVMTDCDLSGMDDLSVKNLMREIQLSK